MAKKKRLRQILSTEQGKGTSGGAIFSTQSWDVKKLDVSEVKQQGASDVKTHNNVEKLKKKDSKKINSGNKLLSEPGSHIKIPKSNGVDNVDGETPIDESYDSVFHVPAGKKPSDPPASGSKMPKKPQKNQPGLEQQLETSFEHYKKRIKDQRLIPRIKEVS